jgi:hypothetical protein
VSATFRGIVTVGVVVKTDNLFQCVKHRACNHDIAEGNDFCPKCGAPKTKRVREPVDGYNGDDSYQGFEVHRVDYASEYSAIGKQIGIVGGVYGPYSQEISIEELSAVLGEMRASPLNGSPFGPVGIHLCLHID